MHNLLLYYLWAKHSFPSAGTILTFNTYFAVHTLVVAGDTHNPIPTLLSASLVLIVTRTEQWFFYPEQIVQSLQIKSRHS